MQSETTRLEGLSGRFVDTDSGRVFVSIGGEGPPLLLLHGFPQTSLMWRDLLPELRGFTLVAADLPGYGQSDCPPELPEHAAMSKRAMAATLVAAMQALGFARFAVAGHDRGGRVAYRMAFDHPEVVSRVAVLDVVPTAEVWARADARLPLSFWPFSLLAQPAPLPERLLLGAPEAVIDDALEQWGTNPECFPPVVREAYVAALRDPAHVHAICEEYRAAATIDREHDEADRKAGRKIAPPLLALWSAEGALAEWYREAGGPLGLWRDWTETVSGKAISGGHFFPEAAPTETASALARFFRGE